MNINVGIGELNVNRAPVILETRGLGSCVGVTLYDTKNRIGALAHMMLPHFPNPVDNEINESMKFRYVDYALPYMLKKMIFMGSNQEDIVAKVVGGASMFKRKSNTLNIGEKNVNAVKNFLRDNSIKLEAEEIGGEMGRTVFFDLNSGVILMKVYGNERKEIEI